MTSGAELLAKIKPKLRELGVEVCLRPDLLDEWEEAQDALVELRGKDTGAQGRLGAGSAVSAATEEAARRVVAIEEQIKEASVMCRLRALPKDVWAVLCEQHPPRPGNDMDMILGYNRDSVFDGAVRECMYEPVFDDQSWAEFVQVLSAGEWKVLKDRAAEVNSAVTPPKSGLAARILTRPADASSSLGSGG